MALFVCLSQQREEIGAISTNLFLIFLCKSTEGFSLSNWITAVIGVAVNLDCFFYSKPWYVPASISPSISFIGNWLKLPRCLGTNSLRYYLCIAIRLSDSKDVWYLDIFAVSLEWRSSNHKILIKHLDFCDMSFLLRFLCLFDDDFTKFDFAVLNPFKTWFKFWQKTQNASSIW